MNEKLLEEIRDILTEIRDVVKRTTSVGESQLSVTMQQNDKNKEISWGVYLEKKQTKNDYEIIALVVDQLTQNEKISVSKKEIVHFISENPDHIKNAEENKLSAAIDNTKSKYKYIKFVNNKENRTYQLTIKGKQLVDKLPERPNMQSRKKPRKSKKR